MKKYDYPIDNTHGPWPKLVMLMRPRLWLEPCWLPFPMYLVERSLAVSGQQFFFPAKRNAKQSNSPFNLDLECST